MEEKVDPDEFIKLLKGKDRNILLTDHSLKQAKMRQIIKDDETDIKQFKTDIYNKIPFLVAEQDSENPNVRKFKLYYRSTKKGFIVYIISVNAQIRLITIYPTTKSLQKQIYKYRKRGV